MAQNPKKLAKLGSQARFNPTAFTQMIQAHGFFYQWSRALECPCRLNGDTDQWDPTCSRCGGDGWMYVNPCSQTERHLDRDYTLIQAIFSNVATTPSIAEEFGSYAHGEAQLTVHNEHRIGYRDRLVGIEQLLAHTELLVRGAGDDVPVGKSGRPRAEQVIAMRYEPVEINHIEDDDGAGVRTIYYNGLDFFVREATQTEPRKLSWLPGRGPPEGRLYSVHYVMHPVWVVDSGVYAIQHARGPLAGLSGTIERQLLPTTFKVALDYLTSGRGT